MTAPEILHIVLTVGICQLGCDLLANYLVYNGDAYKRTVGALERARWKLDKAEADAAKSNKHAKRLQRAKDDYGTAKSLVARKHFGPGIFNSIFFLMLLRILGTEHKGNIMAILPFEPFNFLTRITARGLDWDSALDKGITASVSYKQGASFFFIYALSALSVKFYVNKAFGVQPPPGADGGIVSMMESPGGRQMIKNIGLDPDEILDATKSS